LEGQRQLLMFGSRNRRTKSRKERSYAPCLANSWLRHCRQDVISFVSGLSV